jgi:hypothetical protein
MLAKWAINLPQFPHETDLCNLNSRVIPEAAVTRYSIMFLVSTCNPEDRVFFSREHWSRGACIVFLWQEERSNEEALASSPFAQWSLAVSKPVLQHGISRRDFFIGGQKALRCFRRPRL